MYFDQEVWTDQEICLERRKTRPASGWRGTETQIGSWSRGRPCSGPNPTPRSARCCRLGSGSRHCELGLPLEEKREFEN